MNRKEKDGKLTRSELYCTHGTFPDACYVCLEAETAALRAKVEALTQALDEAEAKIYVSETPKQEVSDSAAVK